MSRTSNALPRAAPARTPAHHPVWSLTLPAWASAPGPERHASGTTAFASALARLRRLRRGAEATVAADPAGPTG
jgi:hypothetical protein